MDQTVSIDVCRTMLYPRLNPMLVHDDYHYVSVDTSPLTSSTVQLPSVEAWCTLNEQCTTAAVVWRTLESIHNKSCV